MKKLIPIILILLLLPSPASAREGSGLVQTWDNPPTETEPQPTAEPTQPPTQSPGPYPSMGLIWADTADSGHCDGFTPAEGNSAPPALSWPVPGGVLNSNRAFRVGHTGLDIVAPIGRAVESAAGGTIVWAGVSDYFGDDALVVAVYHGGGWVSIYAHLSAVLVDCWEGVGSGDIIGRVGMTGAVSTDYGPHLHFDLRNGNMSYNPLLFMDE